MRLIALLFDALGFDERCLLLDGMDMRDIQALACTCISFLARLSPMDLDLFHVNPDAYTWADRSLTLPPPWHGGISIRMGLPVVAQRLAWRCCIKEHRASKMGNQWIAFGLAHVDDSGWHYHLVSDRGCVYVQGTLQKQKLPELKVGDELTFNLDLSGKGSLSVRVNRGTPHVLSGSRGLVAGRGPAADRVRGVFARAHIWDGSMVKSRSKVPRAERRAFGPHCVLRFLAEAA